MAKDIETLVVRLIADVEDLKKGLRQAESHTSLSVSKIASSIGTTIAAGAAVAAAAVVGIGAAALKMSLDFNRSMANVGSLIPGNTARVNELSKAVLDMSVKTGKGAMDLSAGLYQLVSAFGNTADTAQKLEINARLAAAGLSTVKEAIDLTSAVTKAYGDTSAEAIQHVADLAATAVRLGQTTLPELAGSIGRVTPLTAGLGVTMEETAAVMATFTGVTGSAAEVSTQLRGFLQALMSPTEDMIGLFKEMGVESGKDLIEMNGLQGAIDEVAMAAEKAGVGGLQKLVGSIEGQTFVMSAADKMAKTLRDNIKSMGDVAGANAAAFDAQNIGIGAAVFAWDRFNATVTKAMIDIGTAIGPTFAATLDAIGPVIDRYQDSVAKFVGDLLESFRMLAESGDFTQFFANLEAQLGPVWEGIKSMASAAYEWIATRGEELLDRLIAHTFDKLSKLGSMAGALLTGGIGEAARAAGSGGFQASDFFGKAGGGMAQAPQLALIGEGSYSTPWGTGAEAVVPLHGDPHRNLSKIIGMAAGGVVGTGAGMTYGGSLGGGNLGAFLDPGAGDLNAAAIAALKAQLLGLMDVFDYMGKGLAANAAAVAANAGAAGPANPYGTQAKNAKGEVIPGLFAWLDRTDTGAAQAASQNAVQTKGLIDQMGKLELVFESALNYELTSGQMGAFDWSEMFPNLDQREVEAAIQKWRKEMMGMGAMTIHTTAELSNLMQSQKQLGRNLIDMNAAAGGATYAMLEEAQKRKEMEDKLFAMGMSADMVNAQMNAMFGAAAAATQAFAGAATSAAQLGRPYSSVGAGGRGFLSEGAGPALSPATLAAMSGMGPALSPATLAAISGTGISPMAAYGGGADAAGRPYSSVGAGGRGFLDGSREGVYLNGRLVGEALSGTVSEQMRGTFTGGWRT